MRFNFRDLFVSFALSILANAVYALFVEQSSNLEIVLFITFLTFMAYLVASAGLRFWFILQSGIERTYKDYEEAKSAILDQAMHSTAIRLTTIGGGTIFAVDWGEFLERIEARARKGMSVKMLLIDPESDYLERRINELAIIKPGKFNLSGFKNEIANNIEQVRSTNQLLGENKIEMRFYDALPTWRLYIFDNSIFVSSFLRNAEGHDTTEYQFGRNSDMYKAFSREFDYLWEIGKVPESFHASARQ